MNCPGCNGTRTLTLAGEMEHGDQLLYVRTCRQCRLSFVWEHLAGRGEVLSSNPATIAYALNRRYGPVYDTPDSFNTFA